jgi:succinoglycan biosynthesis protein ExoM
MAVLTKPVHITVCICTFKRPLLLKKLLEELASQETDDRFMYSIVVADNDEFKSAWSLVKEFEKEHSIPIRYCHEPRQNIALARNRAVQNAEGDFITFIDDDEFPTRRWLLTLLAACRDFDADGALGSVKPHFHEAAPQWVVRGGFYDRPSYPTGLVVDGSKGRTGNTLLKRSLFDGDPQPFRPEFLTGEDQDFFRRMIAKGHKFVWCDEAVAYEIVPPIRWRRSFMIRRALLRGAVSVLRPNFGVGAVVTSVAATVIYGLILPFALVLGQRWFMTYLIKSCDHWGRLLATIGIKPIRAPYVTD